VDDLFERSELRADFGSLCAAQDKAAHDHVAYAVQECVKNSIKEGSEQHPVVPEIERCPARALATKLPLENPASRPRPKVSLAANPTTIRDVGSKSSRCRIKRPRNRLGIRIDAVLG
jgi:hypothetical protein